MNSPPGFVNAQQAWIRPSSLESAPATEASCSADLSTSRGAGQSPR